MFNIPRETPGSWRAAWQRSISSSHRPFRGWKSWQLSTLPSLHSLLCREKKTTNLLFSPREATVTLLSWNDPQALFSENRNGRYWKINCCRNHRPNIYGTGFFWDSESMLWSFDTSMLWQTTDLNPQLWNGKGISLVASQVENMSCYPKLYAIPGLVHWHSFRFHFSPTSLPVSVAPVWTIISHHQPFMLQRVIETIRSSKRNNVRLRLSPRWRKTLLISGGNFDGLDQSLIPKINQNALILAAVLIAGVGTF